MMYFFSFATIPAPFTTESVVTEGAFVVVSKYGITDVVDTTVVVGLSVIFMVVEENVAVAFVAGNFKDCVDI